MRQVNTITAEIVELSVIKSAYIHFLASHDAQVDVENATYIHSNKCVISKNLANLYAELEQARKAQPEKPKLNKHEPMKIINYQWTETEQRAIMHFNSDKRYTITE